MTNWRKIHGKNTCKIFATMYGTYEKEKQVIDINVKIFFFSGVTLLVKPAKVLLLLFFTFSITL